MNILRQVDPTTSSGSGGSAHFTGNDLTFATLRTLVRNGDLVTMRHAKYFASVSLVPCPPELAGNTCYDASVTVDPNHKGHFEALRGYSLDSSGNYQFFWNNPDYGRTRRSPLRACAICRAATPSSSSPATPPSLFRSVLDVIGRVAVAEPIIGLVADDRDQPHGPLAPWALEHVDGETRLSNWAHSSRRARPASSGPSSLAPGRVIGATGSAP